MQRHEFQRKNHKCPTLVADSLTPSVFKSSLCLSEKNCLNQYKLIPHPWGERVKFSDCSTQPCLALQGGGFFFSPLSFGFMKKESPYGLCLTVIPATMVLLHTLIVAALTGSKRRRMCLGSVRGAWRGGFWEINIPHFLSKQRLMLPTAFGKVALNYQVICMEGHRSTLCNKFKLSQ